MSTISAEAYGKPDDLRCREEVSGRPVSGHNPPFILIQDTTIMAGASLLTLLDVVATLLDDVATMTKVATKNTAGVLGDDLALNAEQVSGIRADRELPVVWAVARGSMINKAILVPAALLISALVPMLITPLLMLGGAFLCYEGVEKVLHKFLHGAEEETHHREK